MIKLNFSQIFKLMRPKQWIKNLFIFGAVIFSGKFTYENIFIKNIFVFFIFCLVSSCVYILNDLVDVNKDRQHPEKKNRPIASGKVKTYEAVILEVLLIVIVIITAYNLDIKLFMVFSVYFIINILYSIILKNLIIIDVMIITLGFVLRVQSGAIITNVQLSPWMILCTILISLFMALNKRKSEIIILKDKSGNHRKILDDYSVEFIDNMLTIVTPSIFIAYCLYTFSSTQSRTMMITIPFVLYGIFRYQYLMMKQNIGGKPEDIFQKDIPFLVNILLWCISVILIIYFKL